MCAIPMDAKKLLIEIGLLIVTVVVMIAVYKHMSKSTAEDFWTKEREQQSKRLFGDAWKEAMDLG